MAESITFDVLARDRASASFNRIGQNVEQLESRVSRFQRTARNFAGTLVGAEIGRSVLEAADKFELSRSRLETITKNIGADFAGLSKQVDAADAHMAALGFTAADTEGALASLESVTRDPARALRDLALAADIARGRNIGLNESVLILQRVETGHVAQLAKLGIATKDAAGHTLTQTQALQMLTNLYGGAASRYADTFAGKQQAVRAELQNSAAQIGVALLPAAVQLANVLSHDLLPPLVATARWFDRNRKAIEPLVKATLISVAAWKSYVLWTKAAAAANTLFGRSAVAAEAGAAATATAAARGAAGGAGAAAAGGAGTAIGAGMAAGLGTGAAIASRLFTAVKFAPVGAVGAQADLGRMPSSDKDVQAAIPFAEKLVASHAKITAASPALSKALDIVRQRMHAEATQAHALVVAQTEVASSAQRTASQVADAAQKLVASSAAQDGLRQAMHAAAQTAVDNGRAIVGNSDAALANRDAVRQQVSAVFGVVDAMKAQGRSASAQSSMMDILTQAVEQNATKVYGDKAAVDALLRSLGLIPSQVGAAVSALAALQAASALDVAAADRTDLPGRSVKAPAGAAALSQAMADARKAADQAKVSGDKIAKSFMDGFSPTVHKAADAAAKKAADAAKQRFDQLKQQMQTDFATIKDAIASTQQSLMGFAAITNNLKSTDTLGAAMAGDVFANRRGAAAKLKQFAGLYERLSRVGLNATDLHQFIQAGPDAIPAMQQILAAGRGGVRQINALERQIASTTTRLGTEDAAAQNLGLIHNDLSRLPAKIAAELERKLRALRIITDKNGLDAHYGAAVVTAG